MAEEIMTMEKLKRRVVDATRVAKAARRAANVASEKELYDLANKLNKEAEELEKKLLLGIKMNYILMMTKAIALQAEMETVKVLIHQNQSKMITDKRMMKKVL